MHMATQNISGQFSPQTDELIEKARTLLGSYLPKHSNHCDEPKSFLEIEEKHRRFSASADQQRLAGLVSRPCPGGAQERRLLLVIDFAVQPYNLGDLIIYQAAAEALRELCGVAKTDVCLISDPGIAPSDDNIRKFVNPGNRYYHLFSIVPVIQTNPHLGSLLLFDSRQSAREHIQKNITRYFVWPRMETLDSPEYLFYPSFHLLRDFHHRFGRLPVPYFTADQLDWYRQFIGESVGSNLPVTVNLRNNRIFHNHRNSDLNEWLAFFNHCNGRYPVTFVIACSADEVDPRFRSCANVVVAKDYHTTLIQDLTLIRFSAFHMGASSGPAALTLFTGKPYLVVNCDMLPHIQLYHGALVKGSEKFLRFSFAGNLQKYSVGRENRIFLIREFDSMYRAVDRAKWRQETFGDTEKMTSLSKGRRL